eukprot:444214-Karenia_brevis.AAC.1
MACRHGETNLFGHVGTSRPMLLDLQAFARSASHTGDNVEQPLSTELPGGQEDLSRVAHLKHNWGGYAPARDVFQIDFPFANLTVPHKMSWK